MHRDPDLALETHAREEFGIDPEQLGSPVHAAGSSFVAFTIGAVIPLLPWFFIGHGGAILASLVLAVVAAAAVGAATARFTGRPAATVAARQLATLDHLTRGRFAIGHLVGANV